jgi:hypothetical protein
MPKYIGKKLDSMQSEDFTRELVSCFANHLFESSISFETARNYMSSLYTFVKDTHAVAHANVIAPNSAQWQKELLHKFTKECREQHIPLTEHKIPIDEQANEYLCKRLFARGLYEEGALQACDSSCGGRITEGVGLVWADLLLAQKVETVEPRCCVAVDWYRGKTHTLTATYMFINARSWAACCLHSLARMVVLSPSTSERLFPRMAEGRVVLAMNTLIKSIYEEWKRDYDAGAVQREHEAELGIVPETEPVILPQHMTTHGNRSACITRALDAGIEEKVAYKHCGLACSKDKTERSYNAVAFESDSQVTCVRFPN